MHIAVLSGFAASLVVPWLHRISRNITGWIVSLLPVSIFIYFATFIKPVSAGETFTASVLWVPSLDIALSFHIDGLSLLFALLITGIGAFVIIYGGGYLEGHEHLDRFYAYILTFMASMLGVVLADNIFSLFVFWELTSLSSYLLIGFDHEKESARSAALQALLVTSLGGLAMLAGFVLLNVISGSSEISIIATHADMIKSHPLFVPTLLLILAGAFTKSAQAPFHFWLPSAMEAPTPVSAYLHSATMVKAGVYLLARMNQIFGGTEIWLYLLLATGAITMLVGAYLALSTTELKRMLAYTTISALGTLVMLIGLGTGVAIEAATVYLLAHALYKAALFMVAGALYHETGTMDVDKLGGLWRHMPKTAVIAGLSSLSLLGIGPILSFIGKELTFEATLESPYAWPILIIIAILASAVNIAIALIIGIWPFFRSEIATPKKPHEPNLSLLLGPAVLASLGLLFGIFPFLVSTSLVSPTTLSILGQSYSGSLALWHGLSTPLVLSGFSLLIGGSLYWRWIPWRSFSLWLERFFRRGPTWWYHQTLDGLNSFAINLTRILQSGHLHYYLLITILTTVGLVGYAILAPGRFPEAIQWQEIRFYEILVLVMILAATFTAVKTRSRLTAVAALGVIGYGVALTFIFFGAPDLAMTQVLVETMTVILLVLVLYHLPGFARLSGKRDIVRDAFVSVSAGILMTFLVIIATSAGRFEPISTFFIEHSLDLAHGRNIVNDILVDFRALDTLGEITVLALAGVGVFALLKLRPGKGEGSD